jgi:hypothetical protein
MRLARLGVDDDCTVPQPAVAENSVTLAIGAVTTGPAGCVGVAVGRTGVAVEVVVDVAVGVLLLTEPPGRP